MKVIELITDAFYLSGILGREFETLKGNQSKDGLTLLNDILGERNSDGAFLPYYERTFFDSVPGQEYYFIPNLVELDTLTVTLNNVRFSMQSINRDAYFGSSRVNGIESLPFMYYTERQIHSDVDPDIGPGMGIWSYWLSNQSAYIFELVGRYSLANVTLFDTISDSLERFYLSYLKYKLASRLCEYYDHDFGQNRQQTMMNLERQINNVNPVDSSLQIASPFRSKYPFNWGDANLGHGFRP